MHCKLKKQLKLSTYGCFLTLHCTNLFCFHSYISLHLLWSRPYLVNLLPCLARITKRQEETVQETLAAAMPKIMAALGHFANDGEIKVSIQGRSIEIVEYVKLGSDNFCIQIVGLLFCLGEPGVSSPKFELVYLEVINKTS